MLLAALDSHCLSVCLSVYCTRTSYTEFMLAALLHDWDSFRLLRARKPAVRFAGSLKQARSADNETVADMVQRIYGVEILEHLFATVDLSLIHI